MFLRILSVAMIVAMPLVEVRAQSVAPVPPPENLMEPAAIADQPARVPLRPAANAGAEVVPNVVDSGTNGDIFMTSPAPFTLTGVLLQAKASWPFVVARTGTSDFQSGFTVANSAAGELMRVQGDGKVGIGTTTPASRLTLFSNTLHHLTLQSNNPSVWHLTNFNSGYFGIVKDGGTPSLSILNDGKVGINTTAPGAPFTVYSNTANQLRLSSNNTTAWELVNSNSGYFGITAAGAATPALAILNNGNIGIGTSTPTARLHVSGNLSVTGDITGARVLNAIYQDVAEWVTSAESLEDGTVVIIAPGRVDEVVASTEAYDTRVAGVVSRQPGVLLGVPGEAKLKIATTGRVKVKVDATASPILAGDLLVSSSKPGTAMRSEPADVAGIRMHRPGTLVGKALEPLETGTGEILVLLSLQ
ncbi:MAG TPA: hypothetical protein VNA69_21435 [Thermoanaerobaculia bacterium]|nr:hypothetical protein [Thermoanaerobaculia bacterium]